MSLLKNEFRKTYLQNLVTTVSGADIPLQSEVICQKLVDSVISNDSFKNIAVYMSQDNEVDTMLLIKEILKTKNKAVFLPICVNTNITKQDNILLFPAEHRVKDNKKYTEIPPRQHHLLFKKVKDYAEVENMKPIGRYQIREPVLDRDADALNDVTIPHTKLDLVIVPAVMLDEVTKMRIGYGKGYYDDFVKRFLYNNWKAKHGNDPMETLLAIELFKTWKEDEFKKHFSLQHNYGSQHLSQFVESYLKVKAEWEKANDNQWFTPLLVGIALKEQLKKGEILKEELHDWEMDVVVSV